MTHLFKFAITIASLTSTLAFAALPDPLATAPAQTAPVAQKPATLKLSPKSVIPSASTIPPAPKPAPTPEATPAPTHVPVPAQAPQTVQPTSANTLFYRQLDELRSQNAVLAERLKNAELQNKLNEAGRTPLSVPALSSMAAQTPQGGTNYAAQSIMSNSNQSESSSSVQFIKVSGSSNNLTALLSLPNGGQLPVRIGTQVAGLGTVKSISLHEIVISGKKKEVAIPFSTVGN
jgi:type IV pilus biogenesis protein PilP